MGPGTIRGFLDKLGFDWATGRIVFQVTGARDPGWCSKIKSTKLLESDSPELDHQFDTGHGGPECPRFIAEDKDALFFPVQYDGATWPQRVEKDIETYLNPSHLTPYPGG